LGEGGDSAAKGSGHLAGQRGIRLDWNESTFVEVNTQTSGSREVVKDFLEVSGMLRHRVNDDKSIVGVLQDRAREVIN
jgi:hypothetical protein